MLSAEKRAAIEKETRTILERFGKTLAALPASGKHERATAVLRTEKEGAVCDADFRERMFANAPRKSDDCILAEKKEW